MSGRQGFQSDGQVYVYQENSAGKSAAFGLDGTDNKWKLVVEETTGAQPKNTVQITVDPGTDGNITFNPNGTGQLNIANQIAGALVTDASGDVSSITATTGYVLTSNGTSSPTWEPSSADVLVINYTQVLHAASPYTALTTDYYISANVTGGVITIKLPNAPATGRVFIIKDQIGAAPTSNISITTVGGSVTLDGVTTYVMNTSYETIQFVFNGTSYEAF